AEERQQSVALLDYVLSDHDLRHHTRCIVVNAHSSRVVTDSATDGEKVVHCEHLTQAPIQHQATRDLDASRHSRSHRLLPINGSYPHESHAPSTRSDEPNFKSSRH